MNGPPSATNHLILNDLACAFRVKGLLVKSTVHIVDQNEETQIAVRHQLIACGLDVQAHTDAQKFVASADCLGEGCILADLHFREMEGMQFLKALRKAGCRAAVLFMTEHPDVDAIVGVMRHGARDVLLKPPTPERLHHAVTSAIAERLPTEIELRAREAAARIDSLPPRAREVLNAIVEGGSTKIIAYELGLSPRTVEIHRSTAFHRLGLRNTADAVRLALLARLHRQNFTILDEAPSDRAA